MIKAPSTVPWVEVASAAAIKITMKAQAMATMYILNGGKQYHVTKIRVIMR
ncbi:hypothetical protein VITFI_CDS2050 [Vitreoscilla filiformis]|uniref:Uncharacterized protein n=1 Tax=Vitreoscilla filiformis TaxID=63 RepID=A0A221KFM2_VITFI|nr:hypothetical protein VITFI_CDS2050 [Vitreoscilla filiformis]